MPDRVIFDKVVASASSAVTSLTDTEALLLTLDPITNESSLMRLVFDVDWVSSTPTSSIIIEVYGYDSTLLVEDTDPTYRFFLNAGDVFPDGPSVQYSKMIHAFADEVRIKVRLSSADDNGNTDIEIHARYLQTQLRDA